MKRLTLLLISTALIFVAIPFGTVSATGNIKVTLNDDELYFEQKPVIENGRTLVPMRAIFEAMCENVIWNGDEQTISSDKGIKMQINNFEMSIGNENFVGCTKQYR